MDISQLTGLGKVAGIGGIALGIVALLIRPVIDHSASLPEPIRGSLLLTITIGAFAIGVLGMALWGFGTRRGAQVARTKGASTATMEVQVGSKMEFPNDEFLDAAIRDATEAWLKVLDISPVSAEIVVRVRPAVFGALKKFAVLDREITQADSGRKLKSVRRDLNRDAAQMRAILMDYIHLSLLHIREQKAKRLGVRCRRRALEISMRETARDLNRMRDEMGTPPGWPLLATDRDRKSDPLDQVDPILDAADRKATYGPLWSALRQYVLWTGRYVGGLLVTYAVEILIAVVVFGLGISTLIRLIASIWPGIAICVLIAWGLLRHFWLGDWLGDFFLRQRKAWLMSSIRDFYNSAIWTYVFLSLIVIKLSR